MREFASIGFVRPSFGMIIAEDAIALLVKEGGKWWYKPNPSPTDYGPGQVSAEGNKVGPFSSFSEAGQAAQAAGYSIKSKY